MKTKTFIENLKTLGYKHNTVQRNKGEKHHKLLIFDNRECGNNHPVGWIFINRNNSMRLLEGDERLFDLMYEYARTPLDEREEEKKYIYKLPILSMGSSTSFIQKFFSAIRIASPDKKVDDLTGIYHFTDKEVEQYAGKSRLLFDACEKIEVTP